MKMSKSWIIFIGLCGGVLANAHGTTYYVSTQGSDSWDGSQGTPFGTVAKGLAAATQAGDKVCVAGGVYVCNVSFAGKTQVTLEGGYSPSWVLDPEQFPTTLAAQNAGNPVVTVPANAVDNTVRFVTLTGAVNGAESGVQVREGFAGSFTIVGCVISNNAHGVRHTAWNSSMPVPKIVIQHSVIVRNSIDGIICDNGSQGMVNTRKTTDLRIYNCTIARNGRHGVLTSSGNADHGDVELDMVNCILAENNAYGLFKRGLYTAVPASVRNCMFSGNGGAVWNYLPVDYVDCTLAAPGFVDAANGDYRLAADSVAHGAGLDLSGTAEALDVANNARPANAWDIGAYEVTGTAPSLSAAVAHVDGANGVDAGARDGSAGAPWKTINYAIGRTQAGGEIRVAGGVYPESVSFGLDKSEMTVRGGYDPAAGWTWDAAQKTVLDAQQRYAVVTVSGTAAGAVSGLVLDALTLTNANNYYQVNAWCGAGIALAGTNLVVTVDRCSIVNNGVGMYSGWNLTKLDVTVRNSVIANNLRQGFLHELYMNQNFPTALAGKVRIYNCTVVNNNGHGFQSNDRDNQDWHEVVPIVRNSIFANNQGYGVFKRGGMAGGVIRDSLFFNNRDGAWGDLGHIKMDVRGNKLNVDPLFVDAAAGDYRLQSGSSAADMGTDLTAEDVVHDIHGVARPQGPGWDAGAHEVATPGEPAKLTGTLYVAKTGSDGNAGTSENAPFASITKALHRAAPDAVIRIGTGTYAENLALGSDLLSGVTLDGGWDAEATPWVLADNTAAPRPLTVIQGNGTRTPVIFVGGGSTSNTLNRLTITGGGDSGAGGGADDGNSGAGVQFAGSLVFPYTEMNACAIVSNRYGVYSGHRHAQSATFRSCLIADNRRDGIFHYVQLNNNSVLGTSALLNCTIANNGGHGYATTGNSDWAKIMPIAINSMFTGNAGYGLYVRGQTGGDVVSNCFFFGNTSADMLFEVGKPGVDTDNIVGKPPKYVDESTGDYRLQGDSWAAASGADLSAAPWNVAYDLLGVARPVGAWDIGAYESDGEGAGEIVLCDTAYISESGNDDTGDGTSGAPWATLLRALASATNEVRIAGGYYEGAGRIANREGTFIIRGGYNPSTWAYEPSTQTTILDGKAQTVLVFEAGVTNVTIQSVTITGATGGGAGINFLGDVSGVLIDRCRFVGNQYGIYADALAMTLGVTLCNTVVAKNNSHGLYFRNSNRVTAFGSLTLLNCTVADNNGCGFTTEGNPDWETINLYARNTVFSGNAQYGIIKAGLPKSGFGIIDHCLFHGNKSGATWERGIYRLDYMGENKSGRDPLFVNPGVGDYSVASASPTVNAGYDLSALGVNGDIHGNPRPAGGAWTLGAYQVSGAGEAPPLADAYVATTGDDTTGDGSQAMPWKTLQKALDNLAAEGTLHVAEGTYAESARIECGKRGITIRGGYTDAWDWAPETARTIINGSGNSPILHLGGANSNLFVHLTLTNGTANSAAGIYFGGEVFGLTVESCRIVGNYRAMATVAESRLDVTFRNTIIANNTNGGIVFDYSSDQFHVVGPDRIPMNLSPVSQAFRGKAGTCRVYNCTLVNNGGTAIVVGGGPSTDRWYIMPDIRNTIIAGNSGWALFKVNNGNTSPSGEHGVISHSIFHNNASGTYNNPALDAVDALIGQDPLFAGVSPEGYALTASSPAIRAGENLKQEGVLTDILNKDRTLKSQYDIGAYGWELKRLRTLILVR